MKKLTNYAPGPRGIVLKEGDTVWIAPGETAEVDMANVVKPLPDLGTQPAASDDDRVSALEARVAELEGENADLRAQLAAAGSSDGGKDDADLIRAAVEGLDGGNDDHWTAAGLPDVAAVSEAMGVKVSRAQIEAAAPDAKRPA